MICNKLYILLKSELKYLLILLDEFYRLRSICRECKITWPNYEDHIWKKTLRCNGFRDPMPRLSKIIEISDRFKRIREKNIKVYTPLPEHSPEITKLYRDTAWVRYEKRQQLESLLSRFKKKTIHRFYPRISKRYKNFKKRRVA